MESFVLRVGGPAGWGIATAADFFARVCIKLGYHVFSSKDYSSRIKGGHNYHTVRISENHVKADTDSVNIVLALDKETVSRHLNQIVPGGIILFNDKIEIEKRETNKTYFPLPISKIESERGAKNIHNAVFLGATVKCLGVKFNILKEEIDHFFVKKPEIREVLVKAALAGYQEVEEMMKIKRLSDHVHKDFLSGNDAISRGALKAGLNFHAQYPMTPVSAILHNLAEEAVSNKELVVLQPEDEIATISMVLGASYAGRRAMTATSGGGFALMVESLGLAGMAEVPLVIIEGQRPGPSTGLPTKQEQGDLKFVMKSGTGDFPLVVIAPGDIEECYTETKRGFYLAEKYQLPVIVLVDKHLTESFKTLSLEKEEQKLKIDFSQRWGIVEKISPADLNKEGLFKRYGFTLDGYQRTLPGTPQGIYTCAGDEHDEVGTITEEKETRIKMMQRRMNKLNLIKKELPPETLFGPEKADLTLVSWGSNKGALLEAMEKLNSEGRKINYLQLKFMLPFLSEQVREVLTKAKKLILVENNYSAQLGDLVRERTGVEIKNKILKYDGSTFTVDELYTQLKIKS